MARPALQEQEPTRAERPGAARPGPPLPEDTVRSQEVSAGEVIGDYQVDEVIGSGSFGVVVRATHRALGREVAIKVLRREFAADEQVLGRFAAEARAVNQIRHPNIIDVYGFGALPDGRHYYVMDLLRGESLAARLGADTRLEMPAALAILRPLAAALGAAHQGGITHRDLKPENVFVAQGPEGEGVRLLDFGVAHIPRAVAPERPGTEVGMVLGTPCYMAPEQALAEPVDPRTDVYALGVMAYRMLTGRLPLDGRSTREILKRQLHGPPPAAPSSLVPGLPAHVDAALEWMLTADVKARCPDVRSAMDALEGRRVPAPRLAPQAPPPVRSGRGRLLAMLSVAATLFAGGLLWLDREGPPAPAAAQITFTFEGRPAGAELFTDRGRKLGQLPGSIQVPRAALPLKVEIRAPGHAPERRTLDAQSKPVQLVTLVPAR
jgi:serine/threonine protein kinase